MNGEFASQTVFIVDDTPNNCKRYRDLLTANVGCQIEVATSKQEALDRIRSGFAPALVLLDVCLPEPEDGYEVCRAIKQTPLRPEIQVVMITAQQAGVLEECLDAGADDFLRRGVSSTEIVVRVRSKLRAQAAYSTLIATQRELERRATITAFAKAVRHDVGNALQRLLAFLYQVDQFANTAREGVRFIGAQVQGLSDLVDAGGEERLTIFFVRQWLEESVRLVTFGARPSIVRNECLPDFDAQIQAFWPNLLATLTELVLNAATMITQDREQTGKAQSGEIVLTAERFNRDSSPWVRVTVADDGPGVPEDIRGTLFDERVTSRRDQGGTGLGLYFARRRIERAGGTIRYEPNEPRGTRFIIELPEAQEPAT